MNTITVKALFKESSGQTNAKHDAKSKSKDRQRSSNRQIAMRETTNNMTWVESGQKPKQNTSVNINKVTDNPEMLSRLPERTE